MLPLLPVVGRGEAVAARPALRPRPRPARRVVAQVVTTPLELQSAVSSALYSEGCHTYNMNMHSLNRLSQRQLRYIEWKGVKIYDF